MGATQTALEGIGDAGRNGCAGRTETELQSLRKRDIGDGAGPLNRRIDATAHH